MQTQRISAEPGPVGESFEQDEVERFDWEGGMANRTLEARSPGSGVPPDRTGAFALANGARLGLVILGAGFVASMLYLGRHRNAGAHRRSGTTPRQPPQGMGQQ